MIVNGVEHDATTARPLREVLDRWVVAPRGVAVAINGEVVRRSQWDVTIVQPTDVVEIVTAVAGG